MTKSIREQIANKCIHFNGLGNKICEIDILYKNVIIKSKPIKFPCLLNSPFTGGCCDFATFPNEKQINAKLKEIEIESGYMVRAVKLIKDDNKYSGVVACPACNGELRYVKAKINGHIHAVCKCGFGLHQ